MCVRIVFSLVGRTLKLRWVRVAQPKWVPAAQLVSARKEVSLPTESEKREPIVCELKAESGQEFVAPELPPLLLLLLVRQLERHIPVAAITTGWRNEARQTITTEVAK